MKRNKVMALTPGGGLALFLKRGLVLGKNTLADTWSLGAALFRAPRQVGAITPSGRRLANAMAREIPDGPGLVVELGGGTGSITAGLLRGGINPQHLIVVEQDPRLSKRLAQRFPQLAVVTGNACNLALILKSLAREEPVKAVVSSLPVLTMNLKQQQTLLDAVGAVTAGAGTMVQYTYGLRCPVNPQLLAQLGITARRRAWILSNLPPATVWRLDYHQPE